MNQRIEKLLAQLTLDEKIEIVGGVDMWNTGAVPRLGIPGLKVTDGPSGARGDSVDETLTSACFPCGSALAASWNPELVEAVGAAIGAETRSKGCHVLLGPTVNIHRVPLAGRHFEGYSEDPQLSARIAVAFIRGVQSQGVGASVKHFVCNDSEFERHTISSEVEERALREIYLPPFEAAVKEAGVWTLMAAYNKVNGTWCAEHPGLLTTLLKEEWGFEGLVVSDWFGARSTVDSLRAGLDLEMPGPPRHFGKRLHDAIGRGELDQAELDDPVRRVLGVMARSGALDEPERRREQALDLPEHRALARRAAREGIVLLRNEAALLPLDPTQLGRLAVIGPNAAAVRIQGGGSARVRPHHQRTLLSALCSRLGADVEILHEPGCRIDKGIPALDSDQVRPTPEAESGGFHAEFFAGVELAGPPLLVRVQRRTRVTWFGRFAPEVDPRCFSLRLSGVFTPHESGLHTFSLTSAGRSRLRIDGKEILDNWTQQTPGDSFFGQGSRPIVAEVSLREGEPRRLEVEFSREGPGRIAGFEIGCQAPFRDDSMERAVAAAGRADATLVVIGTNADWECEGRDRDSLALPGRQDELVERVLAANPRSIVVMNAGSPMQMDWAPRTPALLQLWFPGQEGADALADVLFGDADPGGRLPTTFPRRIEDSAGFATYPGAAGAVRYAEGIFGGYRHYDREQLEPLFPFGHGLSYARFAYGALRGVQTSYAPGDPVEVELEVTNVGARSGLEVVQLYVCDREASLPRPLQELRAFEKIALEPGQTRRVRFRLVSRDLAFWDPKQGRLVVEPGEFELRVGASSRDIRSRACFRVAG